MKPTLAARGCGSCPVLWGCPEAAPHRATRSPAHRSAQEDAEMCGLRGKRGSICQRSGGCVLVRVYPPTYLLGGLKELFLMQKEMREKKKKKVRKKSSLFYLPLKNMPK